MADTHVDEDPIRVTCPYCGRTSRTPRKNLGASGRCKCGKTFVVAELHSKSCPECERPVRDTETICAACCADLTAPRCSEASEHPPAAPGHLDWHRQDAGSQAGEHSEATNASSADGAASDAAQSEPRAVTRLFAWVLISAGLVGWVLTIFRPPSPWILIHYFSLIAACSGVGLVVRRRTPKHGRIVAVGTIIATCGVCWWWGTVDRYTERYTRDDGAIVVDTVSRWTFERVYRRIRFNDPTSPIRWMHGWSRSRSDSSGM